MALAGLIVVADWGRLSDRLPTQVPPRRLARWPLGVGLELVALGVVAAVVP